MSDNKEPRPEPRTRSFSDSKSDRISSRIQSLTPPPRIQSLYPMWDWNYYLDLAPIYPLLVGLIKTPLGAWISNLTILSMCKMWSLQEILQDHCHIFTRIQNLINHKVSIPKEFKPIIIWEASGIKQSYQAKRISSAWTGLLIHSLCSLKIPILNALLEVGTLMISYLELILFRK